MAKVKKSALIFAGLKSGQQILHDLDGIVMNNTLADVSRYGMEQFCRISAPGAAAYTLDKASNYLEEFCLPKFLRGTLPIAAATVGTATAINYFGDYMNLESGLGVLETTKQLLNNYQSNLSKLATLNLDINASYLTGAFLSLKSGARFITNLGNYIGSKAEKKKLKENLQETEIPEQE